MWQINTIPQYSSLIKPGQKFFSVWFLLFWKAHAFFPHFGSINVSALETEQRHFISSNCCLQTPAELLWGVTHVSRIRPNEYSCSTLFHNSYSSGTKICDTKKPKNANFELRNQTYVTFYTVKCTPLILLAQLRAAVIAKTTISTVAGLLNDWRTCAWF